MIDSVAPTRSITLSNPFKNILHLATGDLLSKAMSFFAFVYLARILGVANFGVLEFAGSVLAYLLLIADGGLEMWGTREAAKTSDLVALAARILPIRLLLASASFVTLLLLLPLFPDYPKLRAMLLIYGLTVFVQAISLKWVFVGQQRMTRVAQGLVIGQALFAASVFAFIHSAAGLVWVPVLRLASDLATAFYFGRWFQSAHGRFPLRMSLKGAKAIVKPAFTIGLSLSMGLLNYNFDAVLLGFLRGATFVGWYNAAYKLILVGMSFPISYFAGLFPALSQLYTEDRGGFRLLARRTIELWLMFVVPLVIGGIFLSEAVIGLFYGKSYAESALPLKILLWSAALVILRWVYMDSLRATGHQALDARCAITSACLNVGLNVLLIPSYGMIGAASATAFADLVWFAMAFHYFRREVLPGEPFPSLKEPLVSGGAMAAALWLTRPLVWPGRAILGLLVYLSVQALFGKFRLRHFYEKIS